jgi:hypothetical protein
MCWSKYGSLNGKSVSVFVFENCFRKQKQKTIFCCFFVKKVFANCFQKQFLKIENNGKAFGQLTLK